MPTSETGCLQERLRGYSRRIAIIALVIVCLNVLGWIFGIQFFKSVLTEPFEMKPSTDLVIFGSVVSLLLLQEDQTDPKKLKIGRICGLIVFLIGAAKLTFFLTSDKGLDQQIFPALEFKSGGHSSPHTILNSHLIGLSLIFLRKKSTASYRPSEILALLVAAVSLAALIGYLYQLIPSSQIDNYNSVISVNSAASFLLISLGILFSHPDQGIMQIVTSKFAGGRLVRKFWPALITGPLILGWLSIVGQTANIFTSEFWTAMLIVSEILLFSSVLVLAAKSLNFAEEAQNQIRERTLQLRETQKAELEARFETAHMAGMAEIATGVLRNIGNTLNSLSISAEYVSKALRESNLSALVRASQLLTGHKNDLERFIVKEPKGALLVQFFITIGNGLEQEQVAIVKEMKTIKEGIKVIKDSVVAQQDYARAGLHQEVIDLSSFLEDVLRLYGTSFQHHHLVFKRHFSKVSPVKIQRNKILNVVVNLLTNAKEAMSGIPLEERIIDLLLEEDNEFVVLQIADHGVGIAQENIESIFSYGFTTKDNGHGFGLHSAANAVKEMGGKLEVKSEGLGKGSVFKVLIPKNRPS